MFDKAIDNYPQAIKFVPDCCMIQSMSDKVVNLYPSTIEYISDQEIYDKVVSRSFFCLILFPINIRLKKCMAELLLKILFG